jgi:hypothetical protein
MWPFLKCIVSKMKFSSAFNSSLHHSIKPAISGW